MIVQGVNKLNIWMLFCFKLIKKLEFLKVNEEIIRKIILNAFPMYNFNLLLETQTIVV